jgi:pyridoxamine 5'-phosphate oxidase
MATADIRREYGRGGLKRADLDANPIAQFNSWFAQASAGGRWRKIAIAYYKLWLAALGRSPADANAMVLATVGRDGKPSARNVLLKGVDQRGFIFFTNYDSRKGTELTENPHAALVFYWADQERQVCIAGDVTKISREESEAYFKSRPRGSRLAAWASRQSDVLESRDVLQARWKELEKRYPGEEVPLPPFWGGYVLAPTRIEFWQGRPSRLHDRFRYLKQPGNAWRIERLSP